MSAPGNLILIIALLSLFVAVCGYAAGRLHQRRQTGGDREAAYRDGYEKGSHSVFKLAARVIVPRRTVRAAAPVKPQPTAPDDTVAQPKIAPASSRLPAQSAPPLPAQPTPQPPTQPALHSTAQPAPQSSLHSMAQPSGQLFSTPQPMEHLASQAASPSAPEPAGPDGSQAARQSSPHTLRRTSPQSPAQPAPRLSAQPAPRVTEPLAPHSAPQTSRPVLPQLSAQPAPRVSGPFAPQTPPLSAEPTRQDPPQLRPRTQATAGPAPEAGVSAMGFPVPPAPPSGTVPEPSAVGGVRFQRFPDPRTGGETTVLPDMSAQATRPEPPAESDSVPTPRRTPGHRAPEEEPDTITQSPAPEAADATSSGRHTVPEELVQAATYRLPPDRVFRAKVRDTPTVSDEPTTKLVPKPRQS